MTEGANIGGDSIWLQKLIQSDRDKQSPHSVQFLQVQPDQSVDPRSYSGTFPNFSPFLTYFYTIFVLA